MSNPRITRENYERITPGMTLKQVEEILGPPTDAYLANKTPRFIKPTPGFIRRWASHNDDYQVAISVSFDMSDLVEHATMLPTVGKVHR
jgi:outer membrane protein assembly factor BamE (lipoprotein component of BamABCDE complex)